MRNERIWIFSPPAQAFTDYRHDLHQSWLACSRWSSISYRYRGHPEPVRYACPSGRVLTLSGTELRPSSNASLEIAELSGEDRLPGNTIAIVRLSRLDLAVPFSSVESRRSQRLAPTGELWVAHAISLL